MPLIAYKRTPTFTEDTVPAGLLKQHRTKAGVFGRIVVEAGTLRLTRAGESVDLHAGDVAVTEPQEPHEVAPVGSVRFHLEFCRDEDG